MRLGELTVSDNEAKHSFLKAILHHMVVVTSSTYSFTLPSHKANRFFDGNTILIESWSSRLSPLHPFINYLAAWDTCFTLHPHLWLTSAAHPHLLVGGPSLERYPQAGHRWSLAMVWQRDCSRNHWNPDDHIQAWAIGPPNPTRSTFKSTHHAPIPPAQLLCLRFTRIITHQSTIYHHQPHLLLQYSLGSYALLKNLFAMVPRCQSPAIQILRK